MTTHQQRFWFAIAAAVLAFAAVTIWKLRPFFWTRIWSARIELNGAPLTSARLYRGSQGYIMVDLGPSNDPNVYVVRISLGQVGVRGDSYPYFWFVSRFGALAKEYPDPSIDMMHPKFDYADPHLKLGERSATFQTLKKETLHLEW
jgi:hypothetical protein